MAVGEVDPKNFQVLEDAILDFYQAEIQLLSERVPYDSSVLASKTYGIREMKMNQLNAEAVNAKLSALKNQKFDLILGLTDSALTIGENHTGSMIIRGLAEAAEQVATLSTYKLKRESANNEAFNRNLTKVIRHEVAHVLGLSHCEESESCLMLNGFNFQNTIPEFCPACLAKVDKKYLKN